jgi:hypothetical protein
MIYQVDVRTEKAAFNNQGDKLENLMLIRNGYPSRNCRTSAFNMGMGILQSIGSVSAGAEECGSARSTRSVKIATP